MSRYPCGNWDFPGDDEEREARREAESLRRLRRVIDDIECGVPEEREFDGEREP